MAKLFPHSEAENRVICVTAIGATRPFSALMIDAIPDIQLMFNGQCFPRWLYAKADSQEPRLFADSGERDAHEYVRGSAISEAALASFRETLGVGSGLTADDLFHFVYGELHVPAYRRKYAANLQMQKELPRIPNPTNSEGFWTIVRIGEQLADLHVNYDSVEPWPIEFEKSGWEPGEGVAEVDWFRLGTRPMRHPRQGKAKEHYACAVQRLHHGQGHPR